ncbi:MAG TPA: [LysW]-aminoadipate/[LysW]-glutamate kinase [Nitrososphaeraceae archaeon]|nr:[LysW]-aminoadipate/[LysW]-glutamate kinase [Nitrososphaeraceae archaeon]
MIVIKFGGSVLYDLHPSIIEDIRQISLNEKIVLVHGGGNDVTNIATKLGKEQKFIVSPSGIRSRYTDKETAEIYTMVMSGKINKIIVRMLVQAGISAVGISGIDDNILRAIRKTKLTVLNEKGRKMIIEGGYTGKIQSVETSLLNTLTEGGYVPVVSPIALSENYEFLNVDGDRAAAYIAGNLKAQKVIFLTNVNGLHLDEKLVKNLSASQAKEYLPKIGFGMEKKILASTEALMLGAKEVIISSGKVSNPVTSAINHVDCTVISN